MGPPFPSFRGQGYEPAADRGGPFTQSSGHIAHRLASDLRFLRANVIHGRPLLNVTGIQITLLAGPTPIPDPRRRSQERRRQRDLPLSLPLEGITVIGVEQALA
jgi:hypothetical protein